MVTGIGRVSCVTYRKAESQKSQAISHLYRSRLTSRPQPSLESSSPHLYLKKEKEKYHFQGRLLIQGDSGGVRNTLGNYSMCDSKQKSLYEHGSDFERLPRYGKRRYGSSCEHEQQLRNI